MHHIALPIQCSRCDHVGDNVHVYFASLLFFAAMVFLLSVYYLILLQYLKVAMLMIVMMMVAMMMREEADWSAQCTLEWPFRAAVQGDGTEAFFMSYLSPSQINS